MTVDAANGDPVSSTLTPPASVLTGSGTTYPVYIDPAWHNHAASNASAWTQVLSGYPTETSFYDKNEDLRVGVCPVNLAPNCNGIGVARSFVQMKIPPQLHASTDVHNAYLYMTEDWAASGTKESVRLYPVSGGISRSTDWNNSPAMPDSGASWISQSAAFGYPGCGYYKSEGTSGVANIPTPDNDWQLTDGNDAALGPAATTTVDSITGTAAAVTGGASWDSDSIFATDANFDGTSRYVTPPSNTISATPLNLSIWFKTTTTTTTGGGLRGSR